MSELPPDLSRLGDELARATRRQAAAERARRRERRTRLAATGVAAALAAGIVLPAALDRAREGTGAEPFRATSARVTYVPNACDQPRGATFAAARPCAAPGATDVVALDRRYARQ